MDEGYKWLKSIAERMERDKAKGTAPRAEQLTVRKLLEKFGYQRRREWINNHIRNGVEKFGLRTRAPASVKPDKPLEEATTIMQMNGYCRLPVMKDERNVAGIVTWESIGTRLALRRECTYVRQCMVPAEEIAGTTRLFDAIGHLRNLIHGKFTLDQLNAASFQDDPVEGSSDLTLGGFCRLLENRDNWKQLGLAIDRAEFIRRLNEVRKMRNDVMHFNPDGIDEVQRDTLRSIARFFDKFARTMAT